MDNVVIVTVLSLLIVLVVTGMIAFMVAGSRNARRQRRMAVIRGGAVDEAARKSGSSLDARREALARKLKQKAEPEEGDNEKKKKPLPVLLMQAGLSISPKQYFLYSFLLALVTAFLVLLWGKGPFVILMAVIISFFGIPRFVLKKMIQNRQKKFLGDFADCLEAMTRLLRAGMPVSEAIKMVAREYTGPVGEEMGRIFDRQKIGVSLPEAVGEAARRVPIPEMQMFATAVTIQAQTGSSLSDILEGLAKVIRSRARLKRKVQALSSEAKSSALIIGALPVFVALGMYFINPEYIGVLFYEPVGKLWLCFAAFWMGCGVFCMKQMINFKV
ncbi:MAG: type II secretion system F family protein [Micavibrio sp.]